MHLDLLAKEVFGQNAVLLPVGQDLLYVHSPDRASPKQAETWYSKCLNGDASLFSRSSMVFQAIYLPQLNLGMPSSILKLATNLARVSITYADYNLALKICAALLDAAVNSIKEGMLTHDQIECLLHASRIEADAKAYTIGVPTREALKVPFDGADALFMLTVKQYPYHGKENKDDPVAPEYFLHERDLLHVRTRAYARASLLHVLFSPDHSAQPIHQEDSELIYRLEDRIKKIDAQWSNKSEIVSRYVHWDSLIRGKAMLLENDYLNEARDMHFGTSTTQGNIDRVFISDFSSQSPTREKDVHRRYRELVTSALLNVRFLELSINPPKSIFDLADRDLELAREMASTKNLLHGLVEVALLKAKLLSLEARSKPDYQETKWQ